MIMMIGTTSKLILSERPTVYSRTPPGNRRFVRLLPGNVIILSLQCQERGKHLRGGRPGHVISGTALYKDQLEVPELTFDEQIKIGANIDAVATKG